MSVGLTLTVYEDEDEQYVIGIEKPTRDEAITAGKTELSDLGLVWDGRSNVAEDPVNVKRWASVGIA